MEPLQQLSELGVSVWLDDLSRSLPERVAVELDRPALRLVTQACADLLATRAPGRSLELRIPPYAAVQCVAGPRHTRGTPPNVVETDPLTWIRLAAGRLDWREAVAGGTSVQRAIGSAFCRQSPSRPRISNL